MNYIITEEELTSLEKTGNPSYRKSVEYVIGRIRSRPVMPRQVMPDELLTPDNHPQKGFINWWEAEGVVKNKKRARQQAKKELDGEKEGE